MTKLARAVGAILGRTETYQNGTLTHLVTSRNDAGDVTVEASIELPIRYQKDVRKFRGPDGVERQRDVMRILQAPLDKALAAQGLTGIVRNTDDLDAQVIDRDGNRYETGATKADSGGVYWRIDIELAQAAPTVSAGIAFAYVDADGAAYVDEAGEPYGVVLAGA